MMPHGSPPLGKALSSAEECRVPRNPSVGLCAGPDATHCGCHPATFVPMGWRGGEPNMPPCHDVPSWGAGAGLAHRGC